MIGPLVMAVQLWLLTVALDLLLGGRTAGFLRLVVASGAVLGGWLLVLALLRAHPRPRRPTGPGRWVRLPGVVHHTTRW